MSPTSRTAKISRTTSESSVELWLDLDGTGTSDISTGVPFYDHMLHSLSKHSLIDRTVKATGDVDVAGRPYVVHEGEPEGQQYALIGGHFTGSMTRHVLESFAYNAGLCLHVRVLAGRDPHHIVEAQFKAVARALRAAVAMDPRVTGIPSAKGSL